MRNITFAFVLALFVWVDVFGAGFDSKYEVRTGDQNGDGLTDFYVNKPAEFTFVSVGDVWTPIQLPHDVDPFFLVQNSADQTFSIVEALSLPTLANWQLTELEYVLRDVNFDSSIDMQLYGVATAVSGAADQIIYASSEPREPPIELTALTGDVQQFYLDAMAWSLDADYFDNNAPLVVGSGSGSGVWAAGIVETSSLDAINSTLSLCASKGFDCGLSAVPPNPCWRWVDLLDETGQIVVERVWRNACALASLHVYAFSPGTVNLVKDYSYFNQDALDYADVIEQVMPNGLTGEQSIDWQSELWRLLNQELRAIIRGVVGDGVHGGKSEAEMELDENPERIAEICWDGPLSSNLANNDFPHNAFSDDSAVPASDSTFHHYDVATNVCSYGESGCNDSLLRDDVLRLFSYPSKGLKPTATLVDGTTVIDVYVAPPQLTRYPFAYRIFIGEVTQNRLSEADWEDAIQNETRVFHALYPGLITRAISDGSKGFESSLPTTLPFIFTHGIGINRAGSVYLPWHGAQGAYFPFGSTSINHVLGCLNDVYGPEGFKTLDKVAIDYWKQNFGPGSPAQTQFSPAAMILSDE